MWRRLLRPWLVRQARGYGTAVAGADLQLRSYQEECIQSCLQAIGEGKRRLAISLATGSGKTVVFTQLIGRISAPSPTRSRSLVLVHRKELAEQAYQHARRAYADSSIEIEMGDSHASGNADVTICSVQSLIRRLEKYDTERTKLILIDEAHHAAAKSYVQVLEHFGAARADSACIVVGVSATLSRRDGLRLADAFDHIVYHRDFTQMIKDGWLCPVRFTSVEQKTVDLQTVKIDRFGEFDPRQLAARVNTPVANTTAVRAWQDRAQELRQSTIVFAVDVKHAEDLAQAFRAEGIDARCVTSRCSRQERDILTEAFRRREYPVLVNVGIFTEGFDMPSIDCVLLCRPTRSRGLLLQMIGRGMRLSQGKKDCHVIDMTSCLGAGVVSLPTLYGLDPLSLVDKQVDTAELADLEAEQLEQDEPQPSQDTEAEVDLSELPIEVTYADYDSPEALMDELASAGEKHIRQLSTLNWLAVARDKYILEMGRRGFLRLVRRDPSDRFDGVQAASEGAAASAGLWEATETRKLPAEFKTSPLARPKQLFEPVSELGRAVEMASTYALNHAPLRQLARNAEWRSKPPSPAQLSLYDRMTRKLISADADGAEAGTRPRTMPKGLTMGKVSDYLTKLKHGAKGAVDEELRERRQLHKERQRQARDRQQEIAKQQRLADRQAKRDRLRHDDITVGPVA